VGSFLHVLVRRSLKGDLMEEHPEPRTLEELFEWLRAQASAEPFEHGSTSPDTEELLDQEHSEGYTEGMQVMAERAASQLRRILDAR
jgi:hypothetical protein